MPDWLIWAVVIAVGVLAGWAWTDWRQRSRRPDRPRRPVPRRPRGRAGAPPRPRPPARSGSSAPAAVGTPRPGEIWWADVPYEDGTGSKVRPCLVLRSGRGGVNVLKITSQDKSARDDHVKIPTRSWDRSAERDSFLDLTDPIRVDLAAFRDRAGNCDPELWRQVRKLHQLRSIR